MIKLNHMYHNIEEFNRFLKESSFDNSTSCLVKIFTACFDKKEAIKAAKDIQNLLPNSKIIGSSSSGIVFNGEQYEDETMVLIESYDTLKIKTDVFTWGGKSSDLVAEELTTSFYDVYGEDIHIIFSDHYYDVYNFVESVNKISTKFKLIGGIAGDVVSKGIDGFVFTPDGICEKGAIAFSVYGKNAKHFIGVNVTQEAISPIFTITKADGSFIEEIDGISAVDWFYDYLGINEMKTFEDWKSIADNDHLIRFQLLFEGHSGAGRYVRYDEDKKKMSLYFSQVNSETQFRIGYGNPSKCVQECSNICQRILSIPVESIFSYACLFRKLYLSNCAKWELTPYHEYNVCGIFMMGEIAFLNGKNEFFNGACALSGIAEKESYIIPDTSVFTDLYRIEDDNPMLLKFALSRQSETINTQNAKLMEQLIKQQEISKIQVYIDQNTQLPNIFQYKEDSKKYNFDKLCMIQVENADMLLAYAGQEKYIESLKEILEDTKKYLNSKQYDNKITLYALNQSIFFYAGRKETDEDYFKYMMNNIYKNFQFVKSYNTGLVYISRFVLVLHQEDMIESALNTLQANKDSQAHFLICEDTTEISISYVAELRIIELLNNVIKQNGVTPFYQGIYDNKEKRITKYEALMRLVDSDGKIYIPFDFMGIAKKYHLYENLSYSMVRKVLKDFANRSEEVSINLSAYDINSREFKKWFFNELQNFPQPSRIVIELVETENFIDVEGFNDFITKIKDMGVKIAIDDFGSGYSTLVQIVRMEPDYIKVDGSIIREIISNKKNDIILKTIVFLAAQLDISVVAEYVENELIQNVIQENKIRFSQGYYFAKPLPLEKISLSQ